MTPLSTSARKQLVRVLRVIEIVLGIKSRRVQRDSSGRARHSFSSKIVFRFLKILFTTPHYADSTWFVSRFRPFSITSTKTDRYAFENLLKRSRISFRATVTSECTFRFVSYSEAVWLTSTREHVRMASFLCVEKNNTKICIG